jgi:hypothetical protein
MHCCRPALCSYAPSYDQLDGGAASAALGFPELRQQLLQQVRTRHTTQLTCIFPGYARWMISCRQPQLTCVLVPCAGNYMLNRGRTAHAICLACITGNVCHYGALHLCVASLTATTTSGYASCTVRACFKTTARTLNTNFAFYTYSNCSIYLLRSACRPAAMF